MLLADSMALGTWAGTGDQPGDGHRWIELGGILWRVLEVYEYNEGDTSIVPDSVTPPVSTGDKIAFLLAEDSVGAMPFDSTPYPCCNCTHWNNSGIRQWLNNHFLFSTLDDARRAIVTSKYTVDAVPDENVMEEAQSKLFLLSVQEACDRRYFKDADLFIGYSYWLRSPVSYLDRRVAAVSDVSNNRFFAGAFRVTRAIRPIFKINLSSPNLRYPRTLYSLTVRVKNAADKSPIPGAAVAATREFFTNSKGEAELRLPAGKYWLTVTAPGFAENAETTVTVPSSPARLPPAINLTADGEKERIL